MTQQAVQMIMYQMAISTTNRKGQRLQKQLKDCILTSIRLKYCQYQKERKRINLKSYLRREASILMSFGSQATQRLIQKCILLLIAARLIQQVRLHC